MDRFSRPPWGRSPVGVAGRPPDDTGRVDRSRRSAGTSFSVATPRTRSPPVARRVYDDVPALLAHTVKSTRKGGEKTTSLSLQNSKIIAIFFRYSPVRGGSRRAGGDDSSFDVRSRWSPAFTSSVSRSRRHRERLSTTILRIRTCLDGNGPAPSSSSISATRSTPMRRHRSSQHTLLSAEFARGRDLLW